MHLFPSPLPQQPCKLLCEKGGSDELASRPEGRPCLHAGGFSPLSPRSSPLSGTIPSGGFAMKALAVVLPLALAGSVFSQAVHRGFGSVVFPGGTSSTSSGITRTFGSAVFPGGTQTSPVYGGAPIIGARPVVGAATLV